MKPNTISKKLNGFGGDFSLGDAQKLYFHFGVPMVYFFDQNVPRKERGVI